MRSGSGLPSAMRRSRCQSASLNGAPLLRKVHCVSRAWVSGTWGMGRGSLTRRSSHSDAPASSAFWRSSRKTVNSAEYRARILSIKARWFTVIASSGSADSVSARCASERMSMAGGGSEGRAASRSASRAIWYLQSGRGGSGSGRGRGTASRDRGGA